LKDTKVIVNYCPIGRCESCSNLSESKCKWLYEDTYITNPKAILFVEKQKGLIHIGGLEGSLPSMPPWREKSWHSISTEANHLRDIDSCIDVYRVDSYLSFFLQKIDVVSYMPLPILSSSLEHALLEDLRNRDRESLRVEAYERKLLEESINHAAKLLFLDASSRFPEIKEESLRRVAQLAAHHETVLCPIIPLLLDDLVEEVYLDRPGQTIYFDHAIHGRCLSDLAFTSEDLSRISTLLRAESNMHLDNRNPSLKTNLNVLGNTLRVTAIIGPLANDGFSLNLRRLRKCPFSILDLIENGTLTREVAAALLLAANNRMNITITGAPGSGKTTLLNALDATTPREWRKLYIEDTIESRLLEEHHQLRLCVDPIDELAGVLSKSAEIVKSLHRSPDYVVLGEIQTVEHSRALFEALAAGLRTMQTCHASSASGLVSRWSLNHGISDANLAMMDIVIAMDRPNPGSAKRFVKELVEIRRRVSDGIIRFAGLNILYSMVDSGESFQWSDDGAFKLAARKVGRDSHISTYEEIVQSLSNTDWKDVPDSIFRNIPNHGQLM
jgi:type IV secretory pathway ATPase VirB11/archaellum biosynthesis ATPase